MFRDAELIRDKLQLRRLSTVYLNTSGIENREDEFSLRKTSSWRMEGRHRRERNHEMWRRIYRIAGPTIETKGAEWIFWIFIPVWKIHRMIIFYTNVRAQLTSVFLEMIQPEIKKFTTLTFSWKLWSREFMIFGELILCSKRRYSKTSLFFYKHIFENDVF